MINLTVYYHPAFVAPFLIVIGFVVVKSIIEIIPL